MVGARIKELRKIKKLTQKQLSQKLNVDCSSVTKWETGNANPDFEKQKAIADFFGVSIDYLLGRTDFSPAHNVAICKNISNLIDTIKNPPNKGNIMQIELVFPQIKKGEYLFTHEVVEEFSSYFGVSEEVILNISENNSSEHEELTQKEKQFFYNKYQLLNDFGKAKVESYIDDLLVNSQYRNKIMPQRESSYSIAAWGGDETETTQPPIDEITT